MPVGRTRILIILAELGFVWLLYYGLTWVSQTDLPLWLISLLILLSDRIVNFAGSYAEKTRHSAGDDKDPPP